jgi:UDP-glucose 4-epimerase
MSDSKINRILVTGGAGCIGIEIVKQLASRGYQTILFDLHEQIQWVREAIPKSVKLFQGSILDRSLLRDSLRNIDAVIHLAALLGVRRSEYNRLRCLEINISGTQNVLDACIQNNVRKIVFASSSEVYGEPFENPVKETTPTQGKTVYAVSKLSGEELCMGYTQKFPKLTYTILRLFNTYGPYQVAQFVLPRIVRRVLNNKSPIIYGDGLQERSYCYVQDTAEAIIKALLSTIANNKIYNIGNPECKMNLLDLAQLVINTAGKKGMIEPVIKNDFQKTDRAKEREVHYRYCDITKARNDLNFMPMINLDQGIRMVIDKIDTLRDAWPENDLSYIHIDD